MGEDDMAYGDSLAHNMPPDRGAASVTLDTIRGRVRHGSVPASNGCRLWTGYRTPKGYGSLSVGGRTTRAHRLAYELWRGPIPAGLVLDHVVCDTPSCVNPWHLMPVTSGANTLRSTEAPAAVNMRKTHCANGHEFTIENTHQRKSGGRRCRQCQRDLMRRSRHG